MREKEILKLAVSGLADKEIARSLRISVRTVNTHLTRIYYKNNLKNRAEAVAMYYRDILFVRFKTDSIL